MKRPKTIQGQKAWRVIASANFYAYPMGEVYRSITDNSGIDLSAIATLMDKMPIFLSGEAHKESRRKMATVLAESRESQEMALTEVFASIEIRMAQCEGEFDVLREISEPIWDALFDAICPDQPEIKALVDELPELFFPAASIRQRKRLNEQLSACISSLGEDSLDLIALLTLGVRTISATLALSIYKLAIDNQGKRLRDIGLTQSFPNSALRYVDRVAIDDGEMQGCPYTSGDRFRCVNWDESYSDEQNSKNIFGIGSHVCLGRPISQFIWTKMTSLLASCPKRIEASNAIIDHHEPFLLPRQCTVKLY